MAATKKALDRDFELLLPVQFAERLQIGRSTLFNWLAEGVLVEGEHYIRVGRIVRFFWDSGSLKSIRDLSNKKQQSATTPPPLRKKKHINWNY